MDSQSIILFMDDYNRCKNPDCGHLIELHDEFGCLLLDCLCEVKNLTPATEQEPELATA